ncbi:MAG: hypothetical protein AABW80_00995 [Nanoarchaeota archaeon]
MPLYTEGQEKCLELILEGVLERIPKWTWCEKVSELRDTPPFDDATDDAEVQVERERYNSLFINKKFLEMPGNVLFTAEMVLMAKIAGWDVGVAKDCKVFRKTMNTFVEKEVHGMIERIFLPGPTKGKEFHRATRLMPLYACVNGRKDKLAYIFQMLNVSKLCKGTQGFELDNIGLSDGEFHFCDDPSSRFYNLQAFDPRGELREYFTRFSCSKI